MVKIVVGGVTRDEHVKAASRAGADAVGIVVESKDRPANLDITEAVELARGTPPFLSIVVVTDTLDEKRLRRAIGTLHPHAIEFPVGLDPLVLADLQVSFPEVKWLARLAPREYEAFHDGADALVLVPTGDSLENAAKVAEATRSRVILGRVPPGMTLEAALAEVKPFGVVVGPDDIPRIPALKALGGA